MSSLPSLRAHPEEPGFSRFWLDRERARKSGNYAAATTFCLLLAVNVALLLPGSPDTAVPQGDMPLVAEFRRLPPPPPVTVDALPEPSASKNRKLLHDTPEPDRLVVPEPPAPPKVTETPKSTVKPVPKPVKKTVKPKPDQQRKAPPAPPVTPSPSASLTENASSAAGAPHGGSMGHASGLPDVSPDAKNAILAALLHAVEANKHYPRQARRAGMEGKTVLRVTIGPEGRVTACALAEASGKKPLDAASEKLGAALVGMEIPSARGVRMRVLIPVRYALSQS